MQAKNILETPVRYLKGVGPKRSGDLEKAGIRTVRDLLYYLPARYEDRSNFAKIRDLKAGDAAVVQGEIFTTSSRYTQTGRAMFQAAITDGTGLIHAVWFNQPYLKDYFRKGVKVVLYGKVERYDRLQLVSPEYEVMKGEEADSINIGRIVPIYRATSQLSQKYLRSLTFQAVSRYVKSLTEPLPTYLIARQKLVDIRFAIHNIHFPATFENLEKAYRRIVFDEFFMLQLALALRKRGARAERGGLSHEISGTLAASFKAALPFELTAGQRKAMTDIEKDMASTKPMNRLLEGDVGSGKTVVAAYALALTVQNSLQGVMMAPTEVLARQHFIALSELMMPLGVSVAFLAGGMDASDKERLYAEARDGTIDVIVGTHAVIQGAVAFRRLGLAVIDEQHKFGVTQRALLKGKGYNPHVLIMTATPIPRTLALTVFGDLDISVIRELPKGRKPIATYWVEEEKRREAYRFVREELEKGRQAYVVCPLIEGRGPVAQGARGVEGTFEALKSEAFQGYEVGLLHGRMASREKERVMKEFKKGGIRVLVSTVVIEVGIDVPNATVMVIENAERFGLAQLHQLRGRVGRGEHESFCILLADPKTDEAAKRLKAIEGTLDGFQIAEADLDIRGPGEFFGTRQHGLPEIRFGNIMKDLGIMEAARKEAFAIVARDPALEEEHHAPVKEALASAFGSRADCMSVV